MRVSWDHHRLGRYRSKDDIFTRQTVRRLLETARPYLGKLSLAVALMTLGVAISLAPPLIMREIIDNAIRSHNVGLLLNLTIMFLLVATAGAVTGISQNYLNTVVSQGLVHDLRVKMYEHAQHLGLSFFSRTPAGEIHSRIVNDLGAAQQVISSTISGVFVNIMSVILTLAIMFRMNWQMSILSMLVLPAFALPVGAFGRRTYDAVTRTQEKFSHLMEKLEETLSLSGIIVVKSFGASHRERSAFLEASAAVRDASIRQGVVGLWIRLIVSIMAALGPALLYGYGGYEAIAGRLQVGTIVAFSAYLVQLYGPTSALAGSNTALLGGLALFCRIFGFLDLPCEISENACPGPTVISESTVGLEFDNVTFSYGDGGDVLHAVSFRAEPGKLTAIVGRSGAGKSTILSLCARFHCPQSGVVRLSDVPLQEIDEESLRRTMAIVMQDVFLFHSTLEENIRYGNPLATPEEVTSAISAAQLRDFVSELPDGLQTVVGERGFRLSGGERQRVAVARAILRDPKILLLDEATSSLDSHAERLIQEALEGLFSGRTVVAIAHRLSTVLNANQIIVLEGGTIVERGKHLELLNLGGTYSELFHEQFDSALLERD